MGVTNYHCVNGRLLGETRPTGERIQYLTDAIGSVIATMNDEGVVLNTYRYKPFGGMLYADETDPTPRFLWAGTTGSRHTGLQYAEHYNLARHYGSRQGQWTTVDPLWPRERAYAYVNANPTTWVDPLGLTKLFFQLCAFIARHRRDAPDGSNFMSTLAQIPATIQSPGARLYVNVNDREMFDRRLECKLFLEVEIDSCAVGSAKPTSRPAIGPTTTVFFVSRTAGRRDTRRGRLVYSEIAAVAPSCDSQLDFWIEGYANIRGMIAPYPIYARGTVYFRAGRDSVRMRYVVDKKSRFPDFEYRLSAGAAPAMFGQAAPAGDRPEFGLLPLNRRFGDSQSLVAAVPTSRRCCGSCP